ncbi:Hypothetical predicted protein [Pelobates cultripes]|uniref:Uncharacterized protein n=1 Tax=Pelobates cultripes TaxID=61616 RepID=A0AAD1SFS0_PELCU|nr:Hypothetical predicted protein [Pelobates cultripes]
MNRNNGAEAIPPRESRYIPEMEAYSDVQQRLDAIFARFWIKLWERRQAPQAKLQTLPSKGERSRECREKSEAPSGLTKVRPTLTPPFGPPGLKATRM